MVHPGFSRAKGSGAVGSMRGMLFSTQQCLNGGLWTALCRLDLSSVLEAAMADEKKPVAKRLGGLNSGPGAGRLGKYRQVSEFNEQRCRPARYRQRSTMTCMPSSGPLQAA